MPRFRQELTVCGATPIARAIDESEGCPWASLYSSMIASSRLMP
jgi:hypothetical protein